MVVVAASNGYNKVDDVAEEDERLLVLSEKGEARSSGVAEEDSGSGSLDLVYN